MEFPVPRNITDIRSWFGLVNQVSYAFSMTDRMLPFRSLLKPGTSFEWDDTKTQLFEESKGIIVNEIEQGVKIFDKTRPTCLATHWSKTGIGFWPKNTAHAQKLLCSAAPRDGKLHWSAVDSLMQLNHAMHP